MTARSRRRIRLRATAPPSFLVTVKPNLGPPAAADGPVCAVTDAVDGGACADEMEGLSARCPPARGFPSRRNAGVDQRRPPRTRRNSLRFLRVSRAMRLMLATIQRKRSGLPGRNRSSTAPARGVISQVAGAPAASGRKLLAALRAPPRQNAQPAFGRHAGPEAVAPLSHQLARLIGSLHWISSKIVRAADEKRSSAPGVHRLPLAAGCLARRACVYALGPVKSTLPQPCPNPALAPSSVAATFLRRRPGRGLPTRWQSRDHNIGRAG